MNICPGLIIAYVYIEQHQRWSRYCKINILRAANLRICLLQKSAKTHFGEHKESPFKRHGSNCAAVPCSARRCVERMCASFYSYGPCTGNVWEGVSPKCWGHSRNGSMCSRSYVCNCNLVSNCAYCNWIALCFKYVIMEKCRKWNEKCILQSSGKLVTTRIMNIQLWHTMKPNRETSTSWNTATKKACIGHLQFLGL